MFPDLIDIGFLHLKTYGACMALGFLICWKLIERFSSRTDLSNLIMALMFSGIAGSRIAYVIEHWSEEFAASPANIIRVDQGGLMFYGGLILAIVVFFVWCAIKRERPLALADLFVSVLPLGHAFGRVGCFFYGCCYGRDSNAWCAVTFPAGSPSWFDHGRRAVSVLPTQLFEAAALVALFLILLWLRRRLAGNSRSEGMLTGAYLIGYALIRFCIEFLRGDPRAAVGFLSISQAISVCMVILGTASICYARFRRVEKEAR